MAITQQIILSGLGEIIEEVMGIPAADVQPDKNFVDDLDIDSLAMVEISVLVQDRYDIDLPDSDLTDMKTVQEIVNYIERAGVAA
jgi:acyl carrier protein